MKACWRPWDFRSFAPILADTVLWTTGPFLALADAENDVLPGQQRLQGGFGKSSDTAYAIGYMRALMERATAEPALAA